MFAYLPTPFPRMITETQVFFSLYYNFYRDGDLINLFWQPLLNFQWTQYVERVCSDVAIEVLEDTARSLTQETTRFNAITPHLFTLSTLIIRAHHSRYNTFVLAEEMFLNFIPANKNMLYTPLSYINFCWSLKISLKLGWWKVIKQLFFIFYWMIGFHPSEW